MFLLNINLRRFLKENACFSRILATGIGEQSLNKEYLKLTL